MAVARGFGQNGGHFYSNITQPVKLDLSFIVDAANANGLGIRSLKSNGYVRNVFMHTSVAPGSNDGALNPNPAAGYAVIQLKNNYNYYLNGLSGFLSPNASAKLTSTVAGNAYVISSAGSALGYVFTVTAANATQGATYTNNAQTFTVLETIAGATTLRMSGTGAPAASGTLTKASGAGDATITFSAFAGGAATTAAQWLAAGLPAGLTAAAGQSFIAIQSAQIGGSAQVVLPAVSGITSVEVIGNPNASNNNSSIAANGGAYLLVQFLGATAAGNTALIPTAPVDESIVTMAMFLDVSSVTIDGL